MHVRAVCTRTYVECAHQHIEQLHARKHHQNPIQHQELHDADVEIEGEVGQEKLAGGDALAGQLLARQQEEVQQTH